MKKTFLIILALVFCFVFFKIGTKVGYSQGWSDASCGKGQSCEAGEE